jgi:hypothetical protein
MLLEDQKAKATDVFLLDPRAGKWTIVTKPGSTPITAIATAHAEAPPSILVGKKTLPGGRVGLGLAYTLPPGGRLELYTTGSHKTTQVLGQLRGSPCRSVSARHLPQRPMCARLEFTPVYGVAGTRTIYAILYRHGIAQQRLKIATFHYAPPARVAPTVGITRGHGRLLISWEAVPSAIGYAVGVDLTNGRKFALPPQTKLMAFLPNVPATVGALVHVWPTMADGSIGKVGTVQIKAGKKSTKPAKHKKPKHK